MKKLQRKRTATLRDLENLKKPGLEDGVERKNYPILASLSLYSITHHAVST
jgi:hypothetical protein